jgi:hypothetical protein
MAPPVPIPNTEVKHRSPDGSASLGCARVGSCQKYEPRLAKAGRGSFLLRFHRLANPAKLDQRFAVTDKQAVADALSRLPESASLDEITDELQIMAAGSTGIVFRQYRISTTYPKARRR